MAFDVVLQDGKTSVILATENDHIYVVQAILLAGAEVNVADKVGSEAMTEDTVVEKLWREVRSARVSPSRGVD